MESKGYFYIIRSLSGGVIWKYLQICEIFDLCLNDIVCLQVAQSGCPTTKYISETCLKISGIVILRSSSGVTAKSTILFLRLVIDFFLVNPYSIYIFKISSPFPATYLPLLIYKISY